MVSVAHLQQHGYQIHHAVISEGECDHLLSVLASEHLVRSRAGARHLLSIPFVANFANDSRLKSLVADMLVGEATPFRVTLFDKSAIANWSVVWHQDTSLPLCTRTEIQGWRRWSRKGGIWYAHAPAEALSQVIALRIHLDESTNDNGPLRVIAGTHHLGVLSDEQVESIAHSRAAVNCVADRGGVVAMRPLIIHSSPRVQSAAPRRVLHIEYAGSRHIAAGVRLALA